MESRNSTFLYGDGLGDALSVSRYWLLLAHISNDGQVTVALGQSRKESGLHSHTPISRVVKHNLFYQITNESAQNIVK